MKIRVAIPAIAIAALVGGPAIAQGMGSVGAGQTGTSASGSTMGGAASATGLRSRTKTLERQEGPARPLVRQETTAGTTTSGTVTGSADVTRPGAASNAASDPYGTGTVAGADVNGTTSTTTTVQPQD